VRHSLPSCVALRALTIAAATIVALASACGAPSHDDAPAAVAVERPLASKPSLTKRSLALEMFPCSRCHENVDMPFPSGNPGPHRSMRSEHMEDLWRCDVCHALEYMDELRLVTGERITFDESHRMCGQCHGDNFKDWKRGIHGKTVGSWRDGERHRFTCTDCHDAHAPKPDSMIALPGPYKPPLLIDKGHLADGQKDNGRHE
jgi:hypothetical protein